MDEKLSLLKQMAMADGVLSENEKKLFREMIPMTDEEADSLFQSIEEELESVQSETEVIDWKKKNGLDFEKYVVSKFPSNFKIKSWTGDKFVNGRFDIKNLDPDIIVEVNTPKQKCEIAIECKFHMGFTRDVVFIAKESQLLRYREFQTTTNIPVYIALGVGGSGANPEHFFLIPLHAIKYQIATQSYLEQFKKKTSNKLYYLIKEKRFR